MKNILTGILATAVLSASFAAPAIAEDKVVKVAVLTDMSGFYSAIGGTNSVLAAQMAIEDSGLAGKGWKVELVFGDHQNKPDVAATLSQRWIDVEKVDLITDVLNSGVALAVNSVVAEKNAILLATGAGISDLTNSKCTPNTIHWTYDTYMLAKSTGTALTKSGADSWYFLSADYAFGASLERDTSKAVINAGGKVIGSVKHPINATDFASFLLQAQSSGAKAIGLANAGGDTINSIKQAAEFGLTSGGQKLAALLALIPDIHAIGLETAQGLLLTETFYWDMNDQTREFSKRFMAKSNKNSAPSMVQAGTYAGLLHYFKALEALGGNPHDGAKVVAKMKELPTDDPLFGKGSIQANGRKIHPAYLFQVKSPAESKQPWDYYKLVATVPADQAFMPLSESTCTLK
jgi:branched-chain amino acid transport system substrate-binding protein